ncbi:Uncharacterised protein [Enterobacter cancerogenus]|uniref:Uncharacterized protein n=1 Tax=Enterobacter cancerogenus TaxID=69218 RepID=A0A484YGC5_9ENTR|nr:Uncharacterised protein [Enterobacter cancerogenus]
MALNNAHRSASTILMLPNSPRTPSSSVWTRSITPSKCPSLTQLT